MQFTDQVEILAKWFKDWNECEQTVALYSLLKRVKKCQAKFLCRCLEHILLDCNDLTSLESEANNSDFVSQLKSVTNKAEVIQILLSHLPLLRPGNEIAKHSYLQVLPQVLRYAIERSEYLEESRQLLSYSLIHPAFDPKERNLLTTFLSGLDGRSPPSPPLNHHSVAPPVLPISDNNSAANLSEQSSSLKEYKKEADESSPNNRKDYFSPVSSLGSVSLSSPFDKPNLSKQTSTPSCSDSSPAEGMEDVKIWLKSLRLHKYADIFSHMSYTDMMALTSEDLDAQNVTRGAKNKIILSIKKLHERFALLQSLENSILTGGSLRSALQELKAIIQTPIKRFDRVYPSVETGNAVRREVIEEGDIPSQYTKVLGKACTQLLVSKPDEENITLYLKLLERCLQHQAFTDLHKRRIGSWKLQVNKMYRSLPRNSRPPQSRSQPNVGYLGLRRPPRNQFLSQQRPTTPRSLNPLSPSPQMRPVGMFHPQAVSWYNSSFSSLSQPMLEASRKTASLDHRLGQSMAPEAQLRIDDDSPSSEINDSLVSLCHSVAESALSESRDLTYDGLDGASTL